MKLLRSPQGRRKHFKLGGARNFEGTLFLKRRGALSRNKKGTSLFIAKSWGARAPSAPGSYIYGPVIHLKEIITYIHNSVVG